MALVYEFEDPRLWSFWYDHMISFEQQLVLHREFIPKVTVVMELSRAVLSCHLSKIVLMSYCSRLSLVFLFRTSAMTLVLPFMYSRVTLYRLMRSNKRCIRGDADSFGICERPESVAYGFLILDECTVKSIETYI